MQYKYIKGYGRRYRIYEDGRVQSMIGEPKFLKPVTRHDGYTMVGLRKNNATHIIRIHRLVAEAFLPNPNNLPEVNHIDWVRSNNAVTNLEWVSRKENMAKTQVKPIHKERCDRRERMLALRDKGLTYSQIGMHFGLTRQRIEQLINKGYKKKLSTGY